MTRAGYILYRIFEMLVSLGSRAFNAFVLGGSTHQTTSARFYIEGWPVGCAIVNGLFFWEDNHCRIAWEREVNEARRTLDRAGVRS